LEEQTLIYVGRKDSAETRAKKIAESRKKEINIDLIEYLRENIAEDWSLVKCLKKGIAFHHRAVPKYIQTEIVEAFNNSEIDTIVCTTTLIEGVNTSAKNVIIYDKSKGFEELTGFDIKNIIGRAGRFLVHFIGRVYSLEPIRQAEKGTIEFSYLDNQNMEADELIQISKEDLSGQNLENREYLERILEKHNIPLSLVKQNKFIPFDKQILLIDHLRTNPTNLNAIFFKFTFPEKEQLSLILSLCHEFLFNQKDKEDKNFTLANLTRLVNYYIFKSPSIKELISVQKGKKTDTKIRAAFTFISHYLEFALPKYFTAFANIYNFVYKEKNSLAEGINLKLLITLFEFGFTNDHEIALKEAGLPNDIVRKIGNQFSDCKSLSEIRQKFRLNPPVANNLTKFEIQIFKKYV
jgi:hypothetical protein